MIYDGGAGDVGFDCWRMSTYLLRTFFFDAWERGRVGGIGGWRNPVSWLAGVDGTDCVLPGAKFDLTLGKALRGGDERSTAEAGRGGGGGRFPGDGGGFSIFPGDVVCALRGGGGGEGFGVSAPAWKEDQVTA